MCGFSYKDVVFMRSSNIGAHRHSKLILEMNQIRHNIRVAWKSKCGSLYRSYTSYNNHCILIPKHDGTSTMTGGSQIVRFIHYISNAIDEERMKELTSDGGCCGARGEEERGGGEER